MRPLRASYWRRRTTLAARWWMLRYDARTARRFLRYAALALRGRVHVLDERTVTARDGMAVVRLTLDPLPTPAAPPDAAGRAEPAPPPGDPRYSSLILGAPRLRPPAADGSTPAARDRRQYRRPWRS